MGKEAFRTSPAKRKQVHLRKDGSVARALLYGVINTILTIPCMYGYAYIIFGDLVYAPHLAAISKLVLFSSAVHQAAFSLLSSLPFAIGQVQDAALVSMSKMTANVAYHLAGSDDTVILATAVATTALSTAALGLAVVVFGRANLAHFVSYLPMPVIGGYLAYIGFFLLQAALSLSTGLEFSTVRDFAQLGDADALLLALPGALYGMLLVWVGRRFASLLPGVVLAAPLVFYAALGFSEFNLQDARNAGLVGQAGRAATWSEAFALFRFELVAWWVLPYQIPAFLGMVLVVAFSSSLDVAAIELYLGTPLDHNAELTTVGWSNVVSGCCGGFPGSYIFSQTVFTYHTKCRSRLVGLVVCLSEALIFLLRADPLSFVPLAFFAAMLMFIAWDLMFEWLFEVHHKLLRFESFTLFVTFASIQVLGMDFGLLVGMLVAASGFVVSYASQAVYTVQRVSRQSRVLRPVAERRTLQLHRKKILCLELRGELFFGSAAGVLKQVKAFLKNVPGCKIDLDSFEVESEVTTDATSVDGSVDSLIDSEASPLLGEYCAAGSYGSLKDHHDAAASGQQAHGSDVNRSSQAAPHLTLAPNLPPILVLDCKSLKKIDSSAARVLFLALQRSSELDELCVAYAGLDSAQEKLLKAHGALDGDNVAVFPQLDAALDWCERTLILAASGAGGLGLGGGASSYLKLVRFQRGSSSLSLEAGRSSQSRLCDLLELPQNNSEFDDACVAEYCVERRYGRQQSVFTVDEPSASFFIVLQGCVSLVSASQQPASAVPQPEVAVTLHTGSIFGYADVFLESNRTFDAVTLTDCILAEIAKEALERMESEQPRLLCRLQRAILQFSSLELRSAPV